MPLTENSHDLHANKQLFVHDRKIQFLNIFIVLEMLNFGVENYAFYAFNIHIKNNYMYLPELCQLKNINFKCSENCPYSGFKLLVLPVRN